MLCVIAHFTILWVAAELTQNDVNETVKFSETMDQKLTKNYLGTKNFT